jgi:hypothetical protein
VTQTQSTSLDQITTTAFLQPALIPNSVSFPQQAIPAAVLAAAGQDAATFIAAVQTALTTQVNEFAQNTPLTSTPIGGIAIGDLKPSLTPLRFFSQPSVVCVTGGPQTSLAILGMLFPGDPVGNAANYAASPSNIPNDGHSNSCVILSQRALNKFVICSFTSPVAFVAGTCNGTGTAPAGTTGAVITKFQANLAPAPPPTAAMPNPTPGLQVTVTVVESVPCVTATAVYSGIFMLGISNGQLQVTGSLSQQSIGTDVSFWCVLLAPVLGGLIIGDGIASTVLDLIGTIVMPTIASGIAPSDVSAQQAGLGLSPLPAISNVTFESIVIPAAADALVLGTNSTGLPDPPAVIGTPFGNISMAIFSSSKVTETLVLQPPGGNLSKLPPSIETLTRWTYNVRVFESGFAANVTIEFLAQGTGPVVVLQDGPVKIPVETVYENGSSVGSVSIDATLGVTTAQQAGIPSLTLTTSPSDGNYSFTLIARAVQGPATLAETSALITVNGQAIQNASSESSAVAISTLLNTLRQVIASEITASSLTTVPPVLRPGPLIGDGSDPALLQLGMQALFAAGTPEAESAVGELLGLYGQQIRTAIAPAAYVTRTWPIP